jgi:hypothetical protein
MAWFLYVLLEHLSAKMRTFAERAVWENSLSPGVANISAETTTRQVVSRYLQDINRRHMGDYGLARSKHGLIMSQLDLSFVVFTRAITVELFDILSCKRLYD